MDKTETEKILNALAAVNDAVRYLNEALGHSDAAQTAAEYRRSLFHIVPFGKQEEQKKGIVKFTKKEIDSMPLYYKNLFIHEDIVAHWRRRSGNLIEIRCQIQGKKITASAKTQKAASEKFLKKLHTLVQTPSVPEKKSGVLFREYAAKWLETVKRPNVKAPTYEDYISIFNAHLFPAFGEKYLHEIRQFDIQDYLNALIAEGKCRAAHKHFQILKALFEYAYIDELITRSPMLKVKIPYHEAETGQALTRQEESDLVARCLASGTRTGKAVIFILYTGLRRSELCSAEVISGKWIRVLSAKQRIGRRQRERLIPISPKLKKLLPDLESDLDAFKTLYPNRLSRTFKEWMPNHHLHELRHTFITRAQECGISRELVSLWAGHKADNTMTSNVYTHFSEEYQLKEIEKFDY